MMHILFDNAQSRYAPLRDVLSITNSLFLYSSLDKIVGCLALE